jgi:hypothetical protein
MAMAAGDGAGGRELRLVGEGGRLAPGPVSTPVDAISCTWGWHVVRNVQPWRRGSRRKRDAGSCERVDTMGIDPNKPHDSLVKALLRAPVDAAPVLMTLLPPEIAEAIRWSSLRAADREQQNDDPENATSKHTDLLFEARLKKGGRVLLHILVEHQSNADRTMPVRVLSTMTRLWNARLAENRDAKLLPVISVVLAHTHGGWRTARSLDDLFASSRARYPGLERHIPRFEIFLVDLTAATRDDVRRWADALVARKALAQAAMLWLLRFARRPAGDPKDPAAVLAQIAPILEGLIEHPRGNEQFVDLMSYVVVGVRRMTWVRVRGILENTAPKVAATMGTLVDMMIEKERANAERKGERKGRAEGERKGRAEGERKGRAEGERKGRAEGERAVLRRQIALKFGALTETQEARIDAASPAELAELSRRILYADSVDAVFGA